MTDRAGPQSVWWALFSLKGRIRRKTYALGMVFVFAIWWVLIAQMFAASEGSIQLTLWALLLGIVILGSAYCIYALAHKRFQDLGYRGTTALLLIVFQFILPPFGWVPYLLLAILPGEPQNNEYGPPPVSEHLER